MVVSEPSFWAHSVSVSSAMLSVRFPA